MKYLILLFLMSFSAFGNYSKISEVETGSISKVFTKMKGCGVSCIKLPFGYNKSYHVVVAEMINDFTKPINSKNDIETCIDQTDCEVKNAVKSCADEFEIVFMAADFSDIYCSKLTGYEQKLSGSKIVVEDVAKKAAYDSSQSAKKLETLAISGQLNHMAFGKKIYVSVLLLNKAKGLSKAQKRQLRKDLKEIRDDLFDGSICSAREDIAVLIPDGVLIKASDISLILSKIDAFKTCI